MIKIESIVIGGSKVNLSGPVVVDDNHNLVITSDGKILLELDEDQLSKMNVHRNVNPT